MSAAPDAAPAGARIGAHTGAHAGGADRVSGAAVAVVGFSGRTELWWLRLLKPGFRHCLVALPAPGGWILYDPLSHASNLGLVRGLSGGELFAWLLARGYLPVVAPLAAPRRSSLPPAPFTCVEAVKRILGLRAPRVLTPWQLFRRLTGDKKNILDMARS